MELSKTEMENIWEKGAVGELSRIKKLRKNQRKYKVIVKVYQKIYVGDFEGYHVGTYRPKYISMAEMALYKEFEDWLAQKNVKRENMFSETRIEQV